MARYLTPAKIGLLALVELYTEEAVPHDAILPVLSFTTSHLIDLDPTTTTNTAGRWNRAEKTVSLVVSIKDFEKLLTPHAAAVGVPGRRLWDSFLIKVWSINSLDALHDFFARLPLLLAKTKEELRALAELGETSEETGMRLARNSPFGTFVRKSEVEFERLRFHDAAELWKGFVRYRQPTAVHLRKRNPSFGRLSFDIVLLAGEQGDWDPKGVSTLASVTYGDMLTGGQSSSLPVSTDDVERLLEFQIEQMQKFGNRIPLEIRHQFQDLLNDSFLVPSLTHYMSFLDAWRSGDYPTAFEYLHRYFDYTMQNRDRLFYQYALMNLAVLQADFGCYTESVTAMLETVSTARENRDMTCLNFALNWLFHFGRAHPDLVKDLESNSMLGTRKESLAYLRVKAKETGMSTLWSSVLISEAKMGLWNGDSVATSLEYMVRSSQVIVERNLKNMFSQQLSLYVALWDRLGITHLSATNCEIFLRCHARNSISDDELRVTCRLANILAGKGKYDEALRKLEGIDQNALQSWKPTQTWQKYRAIIKLRRDLHRNDLDGADRLLNQLLQSKADDLEPDMAVYIDVLHIDAMARRGNLSDAFNKVEDMLATFRDENKDIVLQVNLLLAKAGLYERAGWPQRGFTVTVRAMGMALRARLIPCVWNAAAALANILVSIDEFEAASNLLTGVIPRSLECDDATMSGYLYSHFADANMGMAGEQPRGSSKRMEYITKALHAIDTSFEHFSKVEDIEKQCELMAKKAMIMKITGEADLAADYAGAYVSLRKDTASKA